MGGVPGHPGVRSFAEVFETVLIGAEESVGVADVSLRVGAFTRRRVDFLQFSQRMDNRWSRRQFARRE